MPFDCKKILQLVLKVKSKRKNILYIYIRYKVVYERINKGMVQGVSFSNFNVGSGKNIQKPSGNPPQEFLDKLKQAGIPSDIVSKGREAVETYAKEHNIILPDPPKPPSPPAGNKPQGEANPEKAVNANTVTGYGIKNIMEKNNIASTGVLKDDIAAIKASLAVLGKDKAKALSSKFKSAGLALDPPDKDIKPKDAFKGSAQLASLNKHFVLNKKAVK